MRFKTVLSGILVTLLLLGASVASAKPVAMKTAWLSEHETFVVWYAKQKGWDKEVGIDLTMLRFESGRSIVEGMKAYDWAIAGCGAIPALTAHLSANLDIVGVANDESASNALYVRADSPILSKKGAVSAYPKIYGDASTVKGIEILCPKGTSAHYMMGAWLKALGLQEKDVKIKDMPPERALGAFMGGMGDAVALWAPFTFEAETKGLKLAAQSDYCGVSQPVLLVANHEYATKYPDRIEAFLRMYLRAVDVINASQPAELAKDYARFHKEWAGRQLDLETAEKDLTHHLLFGLGEQLIMFDDRHGKSPVQKWLLDIVKFYDKVGSIRDEDRARLERMNSVTDVYLKALR